MYPSKNVQSGTVMPPYEEKQSQKAKRQIQNDFERHWKSNVLKQVSRNKIKEAESFFRPVADLLRTGGVKVLDVGCGDGVHWRYLRSLGNNHLHYTGIDISANVIERLRKQRVAENDRFIQMDATELTEPEESYNVVFSFGALAYTSDPRRSFAELCRVCKSGGWIGVWTYPRKQGLGGHIFNLTRWICRHSGPFLTRRIADLIVPLLGILPTRSKVNLSNSSWRQCREVVLVNIAPKQLVFLPRDEILSWFALNSVDITYEDQNNPITVWGRKRSGKIP